MTVDDVLSGIIAMIEAGGMDRCHICGLEKPREKAVVGLIDKHGKETMAAVCYSCLEKIPEKTEKETKP